MALQQCPPSIPPESTASSIQSTGRIGGGRLTMTKRRPVVAAAPVALAALLAAAGSVAAHDADDRRHDEQHRFIAQPGCKFANGIKHVVHLTFDNVHLRRDDPDVPS